MRLYYILCTEDLWEALENASGKPVATVMSTWTKQMGFPVLSVEAKQVCGVVSCVCVCIYTYMYVF